MKTVLTAIIIIAGFCLVAAGPSPAPTIEQQRASLKQTIKEAGIKYQGIEREKEQLIKKFGEMYADYIRQQEAYAKEGGQAQVELQKIEDGKKTSNAK